MPMPRRPRYRRSCISSPARKSGRAPLHQRPGVPPLLRRPLRQRQHSASPGSAAASSSRADGLHPDQQPRRRIAPTRSRSPFTTAARPRRSWSAPIRNPTSPCCASSADKPLPPITFGSRDIAARRRRGARHRQSLRRRPDRHLGHRLGARPHASGHQHLRELHPDRRGDQSRQLGRRAGRQQRPPGRHQHGDLFAKRRLDGHRLRHPGFAGEERHGADHQDRRGDARLDRRRGAGHDARTGRILRRQAGRRAR